jgi:hypothetical protein
MGNNEFGGCAAFDVGVDEWHGTCFWVVFLDSTRIADIIDPDLFEFEQRLCPHIEQLLQGADFATHSDALHCKVHVLKVFGEGTFTLKMSREVGDEDGAGGYGVNEFEGKELARADEATVVLVDKIEGEDGEEVGKGEVDGEEGVSIADEVEPVLAGEGKGLVGPSWGSLIEEPGPCIDRGTEKVGGPVVAVGGPIIVFAEVKVFVVLSKGSGIADGIGDQRTFQLSGMRMVMAKREQSEKSWKAVLKKLRSWNLC